MIEYFILAIFVALFFYGAWRYNKWQKNIPLDKNKYIYPKNDIFICLKCKTRNNLAATRLQIEAQTRKKIIF